MMQIYKNTSLENIEEEEWRNVTIPGYESGYMCSNMGRIKSLPKRIRLFHGAEYFTKEKIIKQRLSSDYLFVALYSGKTETRLDIQSHIVIGSAWLPNPDNKKEINHKKGIKWDNRITEIEWSTRKENIQHAYRTGLMVCPNIGNRGLKAYGSVPVQCTATGRIISVKEAAEFTKVSTSHMSSMLKNIRTNWTTFIYY